MNGYLKEPLQKMDMLNRDRKVISFWMLVILVTMQSCFDNSTKNLEIKNHSKISSDIYNKTYSNMLDSINNFWKYKLQSYNFLNSGKWYLDSLLCFNNNDNRFVSAILYTNSNFSSAQHDGIQFMYGEKINNLWYFFVGPSIHIPREMVKDHPIDKPLSYTQLHSIALKEVYGGYLSDGGNINEHWFTAKFEGPGWVNWDDTQEKIKSYTRKDYEQFHLEVIRNNWNGVKSDSIKQLPTKTELLP